MEISVHKEGLTKNNKKWLCAKLAWSDSEGSHREFFFIKPWNRESFIKALEADKDVKEKVQAIYG